MNRTLLSSRLALVPVIALAGCTAVWLLRPSLPMSDRSLRLWTGAVALSLYFAVVAYSLRKYMHKLGISPEFRMKVPIAAMERAELRLKQLQVETAHAATGTTGAVMARAQRVLREEGVHRVVRPQVQPGADASGLSIRLVRTMPLGRTAKWLQVHVYLGLAAIAVAMLHGGAGLHNQTSLVLNGLSYIVLVTGVVGVACWLWGPAWLTRQEQRAGLSLERAHALASGLDHKLDEAIATLGDDDRRRCTAVRRQPTPAHWSELERAATSDLLRDLVILLHQRHEVGRRHRRLARCKLRINAWRLLHLPAAVLLLAAVCVHVLAVTLY